MGFHPKWRHMTAKAPEGLKKKDLKRFREILLEIERLHANDHLFGNAQLSAILKVSSTRKECDVDLALRLDVLAVCAVFAFVGAILLGAF